MVVNDVIKCGVEFIEEVHHLVRSAAAGEHGETYNITAKTKNEHEKCSELGDNKTILSNT